MLPVVPGFLATGAVRTNLTGSEWAVVRSVDGHRFTLKIIAVADALQAQVLAAQQMTVYDRIASEHLVRRHDTVAMADGTLALVLDEVDGGSLAQLLGARGRLTAGETVTTLAPLFRALADLHAAGVVHGDLVPGNVVFTADGRPLIGDLGIAHLMGRDEDPFDRAGTGGSMAPELVGSVEPSPAADVYAMAALGWFCLTGAPPAPAATRQALTTVRPGTPRRLAEVLTACLASDPSRRPLAGTAAVEVFDAAPAESVAMASVPDPAAEVTRRIRAAAVCVTDPALPASRWGRVIGPARSARSARSAQSAQSERSGRWAGLTRSMRNGSRAVIVFGVVASLAAVTFGFGAAWISRRPVAVAQPARIPPAAAAPTVPSRPAAPTRPALVSTIAAPSTPAANSSIDVLTSPSSPRTAPGGLVQALVDARALAYLARDCALLELAYAPGATMADVDRGNITAALKNGGTYLGLSFVIKDAQFLDGEGDSARIRATILTPAYATGQPDGRRIAHPSEVLGSHVFSLSHTPHGWRILALTAP